MHHVRRLADGGADTVNNAVAVCPNGHRGLHHASIRGQIRVRRMRLPLATLRGTY
ncbi:MAG: HNH endonuclease [Steroidobacteraceae bacterium]